jgi:hypothetical protein
MHQARQTLLYRVTRVTLYFYFYEFIRQLVSSYGITACNACGMFGITACNACGMLALENVAHPLISCQ